MYCRVALLQKNERNKQRKGRKKRGRTETIWSEISFDFTAWCHETGPYNLYLHKLTHTHTGKVNSKSQALKFYLLSIQLINFQEDIVKKNNNKNKKLLVLSN